MVNQNEQLIAQPAYAPIPQLELSNPLIQENQAQGQLENEHRPKQWYNFKILHLIVCVPTIVLCFVLIFAFDEGLMSVFVLYGFYNLQFHAINDKQKVEELKKTGWICAASIVIVGTALAWMIYCLCNPHDYMSHFRNYAGMQIATCALMQVSPMMFVICVLHEKKIYHGYHTTLVYKPNSNSDISNNANANNNIHHSKYGVKPIYPLKVVQILVLCASFSLSVIVLAYFSEDLLGIYLGFNLLNMIYQCIFGKPKLYILKASLFILGLSLLMVGAAFFYLIFSIINAHLYITIKDYDQPDKDYSALMISQNGLQLLSAILFVFCVATEKSQAESYCKFKNNLPNNAPNQFIPVQTHQAVAMPIQQQQQQQPVYQQNFNPVHNVNVIHQQEVHGQPLLFEQYQQYQQVQPQPQYHQIHAHQQQQVIINQQQQPQQNQPILISPHQNMAQGTYLTSGGDYDNQPTNTINNNKMI
eukprot:403353444